ncbi:conserved Plasmodium protein, unknown function [Plasmodium malariae]|uniref:DIX domain-containing protein n=1 Tax=Plasmodium malariae TaxID=5858 RepID=A0A1C3KFC5_PLAMA|nr:conserved Plasmodium protein, unknown function [Plasmodium malariae]
MSKTTVVFYHIINDKEDKNAQNVFYISKPISLITLNDIKNEFPLIGTYHFRFKIIHNNIPAWVDINDESSPVPCFNSCIYAKVLRLSWVDYKWNKQNLNEKILKDKIINEQGVTTKSYNKTNKTVSEAKEKNIDDNGTNHKSKSNIDMLLFETTPNKSSNTNIGEKKDDTKDQNYFDLMFN